ncbi:MAG: flagellar brake protein [Proteobacteria bacterium]|nr:flagellar brake protein [Pseudomonadota bacterium]
MIHSAEDFTNHHDERAQISIAVGTEVQIEIVEHHLRLKSELIGLEEGEFLILKLSHSDPGGLLRSDVIRDCNIIVRYMFHGAVYGFQTSVISQIHKPTRMLFVKYPMAVEEHNVRTEPRFDCVIQAQGTSGDVTTELVITDMSAKGCRCIIMTEMTEHKDELQESINMDTTLDLSIPIPSSDETLAVSGTIRNINKDDTEMIFGVQFDEMNATARGQFDKLMKIMTSISG